LVKKKKKKKNLGIDEKSDLVFKGKAANFTYFLAIRAMRPIHIYLVVSKAYPKKFMI
jgi:hypothetical protein